ncbi:MAG TPA: type II secretion system F family protein [Actinomycetes bacterium]|jgi:tight adherence protein C|nr:type II secretion system F family protein [Actinomycetes bacterium]
MSTSLLAVGATAVFLAVFAIAYSVQSIVAERRQAYRTLQALRAVEVRPADVRNRELARPARERLIKPFSAAALALTRRFTPSGAREAIRRKLVMAGSPFGWDADRVLVAKVACLTGGLALGLLFLVVTGLAWPLRVVGFLAIGLLGYWLPNIVLTNAVQRRQNDIRNALPDSIDLLTICVEAGLGFDAALAHVSRNTTGPLADEFYRTLQEVQLGRSRNEAMRNLAARSNVPELRAFILAMVQADIFGVSVANVLRVQAAEMRLKRRQLAEERAMKVPIKVLFPVLFCIFPALFVVILGPAIMRIADVFNR